MRAGRSGGPARAVEDVMADRITVSGVVGTQPTASRTDAGLSVVKFRLATNSYRRGAEGDWIALPTNWYSVSAFGRLAGNVAGSLGKGDAVVVTGRLSVRDWERDGRRGTSVDIVADVVGHDLNFGRSTFQRPFRESEDAPAGEPGAPAPAATAAAAGAAVRGDGPADEAAEDEPAGEEPGVAAPGTAAAPAPF